MFKTTPSFPAAAAAILAAAVIAACGSNASSSSHGAHHLTYNQAQQAAVNFAACMRSNGVANFPDPSSPYAFKQSMAPGSPVTQSPAFRSAAAACQHLLPGDGGAGHGTAPSRAQMAAELAFARCVRSHGFPTFPDPSSSGELSHEMLANAGINIHQPAAAQAAYACVSTTHGFLTRADIARFIAGH